MSKSRFVVGTQNDVPGLPFSGMRLIPGLTGYAVDILGTVWSCRRPSRTRSCKYKAWRKLKATKNTVTKYWVVTLITEPGIRKQFRVHCLVLLAFVGDPPAGTQALHWDDNKDNNALSNLRWGTSKENRADSFRNGKGRGANKGSAHHFAKLTETDVVKIRELREEGLTYEALGIRFGVTMTTAWYICNRKTWKHVC